MLQGSSFVNVQLVISAVAALGLAGPVNRTVEDILGRPAGALTALIADHAEAWQRPTTT